MWILPYQRKTKGFQHYFRHLPWQTNNTLIIFFNSFFISDYLGFSLFFKHLRTFSVYQDFSHFSAYFGLSRYVSSFKWSKIWSKMVSDFKFRPSRYLPFSYVWNLWFSEKIWSKNFTLFQSVLDHDHLQSLEFTDFLAILRNGLN